MNEDKIITEYAKKWQSIKLSDSSRVRIKNQLLEYTEFHPVRVSDAGRSIKQVPTSTSLFTQVFSLRFTNMTAFILIALLLGGGTTLAANDALPGDTLYPVKIEVNENIKSALAVTNEAEASLQARLAEERLEEAQELAAEGRLTAEASANISSRLQSHYENAETRSDIAEANGDFETAATVRASLEGAFRTYALVLASLNGQNSSNSSASLITDINAYADSMSEAQATATTQVSADANVKVEVENTVKEAEVAINKVISILDRQETKLSGAAHARAETRLNEAVTAQAEAQAYFEAQAYEEAYASAQSALQLASEVEAMVHSVIRLQTNVNLNTDELLNGMFELKTDVNSNSDPKATTTEAKNVEDETSTSTDNSEVEAQGDVNGSVNIDEVIQIEGNTSVNTDISL